MQRISGDDIIVIKLRNIEDQLIVQLLKNNPDEAAVCRCINQSKLNYKYFFEMLPRHLIEAEVLDALLKYPLPDKLKKNVAGAFKKSSITMLANNLLLKSETKNITGILEKNAIESVLLKGLSLDFSGFRVCRDLDILVKQEDLLSAIEILKSAGYKNVSNEINYILKESEKNDITLQFSWNNQYQLFNNEKNLLLEIHTNLFERKRVYYDNIETMLDRINDIWSRKVFSDILGVYTLSDEDLLMLMCMHIAIKRNFSGNIFILRNLLDVERLICRGIDWRKFLSITSEMNISHYIYFSLLLSKDIFNSDVPAYVFNTLRCSCRKSELFLAGLHSRCFKNLKYYSPLYSFIYKILCNIVYNNKGGVFWIPVVVFNTFVPSRRRMSEITGIRSDSPLIILGYLFNPFRMIFLFFRNLIKKY